MSSKYQIKNKNNEAIFKPNSLSYVYPNYSQI
jgi:hypothetical protein